MMSQEEKYRDVDMRIKINKSELIVALSGSFDVIVKDNLGVDRKFSLNRSYFGLYIPPKTWRHMENFCTNSVSMHVCSTEFDHEDYIRNFETFKTLKNE